MVDESDIEEVAGAVAGVATIAVVGGLVAATFFAAGPLAPFVIAHPAVRKAVEQGTHHGVHALLHHITH